MQRILILFCSSFITYSLYSIDFRIGIMGGANSSLNQLYTYSDIRETDPKLGYGASIFSRFKFTNCIIQPEIGYTLNRVGVSVLESGNTNEGNFSMGQFYTSILMGVKFSKLRFSAGPIVSFTTNQGFDAITSQETYVQQINDGRASLGAMVDVGIDISKRWSIDLRASRTFTQSEFNTIMQNKSFNFSGNTGVLSIMIGYTLFKAP